MAMALFSVAHSPQCMNVGITVPFASHLIEITAKNVCNVRKFPMELVNKNGRLETSSVAGVRC
jgi:hypothetical protein